MWWMILIPICVLIFLHIQYKDEMQSWEYILPLSISVLLIWISSALADYALSSTTEYRGGWVTSAIWDEHWTEEYWVVVTDHDSKGNVIGSHMERRTTYHPDHYFVTDSNNYQVDINYKHFLLLCDRFGNKKKNNPWRSGQCSWGDGRQFKTIWDGEATTYLPCTTKHRYENRVIHSHSIFKLT
jgi:hypothetical protein